MKSRLLKLIFFTLSALFTFIGLEIAAQAAYRLYKGNWYWADRARSGRGMIQPHPYFGACLIPNVTDERNGVRITHNSFRCRGPEFTRPKPAGTFRIATLGGSSTYCVSVSDHQTWQHFLNQELGSGFEVVNMGAPGGTSLETLIQSSLLFSDVQPDIAVYYLGWNDARVQHVKNLWPDWSDSHGKYMLTTGYQTRDFQQPLAIGFLTKRFLFNYFFSGMDVERVMPSLEGTADAFTDRADQRALAHYERNLRNIVAVCRKQGVVPVFVPQILNYQVLTSDKPYGWLPFVRDKDLKAVMGAYNERLARVAEEETVLCAKAVLEPSYDQSDFVDNGHFSEAGNKRFATALAGALKPLVPAKKPE